MAQNEACEFELSLWAQFRMMIGAFWASPVRGPVLLLSILLLLVIGATTYGQLRLNAWNGSFYDALERRDMPEFLNQLLVFAVIASGLTLLNVVQAWLNQITALHMREGLQRDLADVWLSPGRALKITSAGAIASNPDQRLHEDTRILAENTTALTIGLVNSTILLFSFIGVLWGISSDFVFHFNGTTLQIPGYMVWATILYALFGSVLSDIVGSRLPRLNADRYAREADLRSVLVRVNENITPITLARGESRELARVHRAIDDVLTMMRKLAMALAKLTSISAGVGWLALVAPIIIASPMYFSGELSFGGLMMAVGAFNQVNQALRWYVANFSIIADWKATLGRVSTFRNALIVMDQGIPDREVINYGDTQGGDGSIILADVRVQGDTGKGQPGGGAQLQDGPWTIGAGEHVMIESVSGADRHLFFQALAGIWPWGHGVMTLSQGEETVFVAREGYFPMASLRDVMTYPAKSTEVSDEALSELLQTVGLGRYAGWLDRVERWDRLLDKDEEAQMQVANAVLLAPKRLIMEDIFEGMDPELVRALVGVLARLEKTTIVYLGNSPGFNEKFSPRILTIKPLEAAVIG